MSHNCDHTGHGRRVTATPQCRDREKAASQGTGDSDRDREKAGHRALGTVIWDAEKAGHTALGSDRAVSPSTQLGE